MKILKRAYRRFIGYAEIYNEYNLEDLLNFEQHSLFSNTPLWWKGFSENYKSFLTKGKNKAISRQYRFRLKTYIIRNVTKLYLKKITEALLEGHEVRLNPYYVKLYVANISENSKRFKESLSVVFIPKVFLARSISPRMYYIFFGETYQKKFKRLLKNGKKYKIEDYARF